MASNVVSRLRGVKSSQAIKVPCRVATTANITLAGEQTIDDVSVVADDRVLALYQTDASENGIWECDTGAWRRAPDWDGIGDVVTGTLVFVTSGSINQGGWRVSTSGTIVVGDDDVAFLGPLGTISDEIAVTAFAETLLDDTTQGAARTTLGVGTGDSPTFAGLSVGGTSVALRDIPPTTLTNTTETAALAHIGQIVEMNNGSANTYTIPPNATIAFPVGTVISVTQYGAGATTIAGDTGVTLNGVSAGSAAITVQYAGVTLYKRGTNEWIMQGAHGEVTS